MSDVLIILMSAALIDNLVLMRFVGVCPALGAPTHWQSASVLATATSLVLVLSSAAAYVLNTWVLVPLGLGGAQLLCFVMLIGLIVLLIERRVQIRYPLLAQALGQQLPLIAGNCAVLGLMLISVRESTSFIHCLLYSVGAAAGFSLALLSFSALKERMNQAAVPAPFRGPGIFLITAGLMSLALLGLAGMR